MTTSGDQTTQEFVIGIVLLVMFTILVYAINLVVHGLFLRKMKENKLAKYFLSIFPTFVVSATMGKGIEIVNIKGEILLICMGILLVHSVLYWYEIIHRSNVHEYLTDYSMFRINFPLAFPIINLFIMVIWLLFSIGKDELVFSDDTKSDQAC